MDRPQRDALEGFCHPAGRLREVPGRQRRDQRHAIERAAVRRAATARLLQPAALCARRRRSGRPAGQPGVCLRPADCGLLRRRRALFAADRRGAGRRAGGEGRLADRRRDRAAGRQAASIATRTSRRIEFLYLAKPMAVEYRRGNQLAARRDHAAVLRAHRQATTTRCVLAISAWISSSGRSSAGSRPTVRREAAGLQGRRPASRDRRQAGRLLLAHPGTDRRSGGKPVERDVRPRRQSATRRRSCRSPRRPWTAPARSTWSAACACVRQRHRVRQSRRAGCNGRRRPPGAGT